MFRRWHSSRAWSPVNSWGCSAVVTREGSCSSKGQRLDQEGRERLSALLPNFLIFFLNVSAGRCMLIPMHTHTCALTCSHTLARLWCVKNKKKKNQKQNQASSNFLLTLFGWNLFPPNSWAKFQPVTSSSCVTQGSRIQGVAKQSHK